MAKVNFCACTYQQYQNALNAGAINNDTLYFIDDIDKQSIRKGEVNVTDQVVIIPATTEEGEETPFPDVEDTVPGKFYIHAGTFELAYRTGDALLIVSPGYITDSQHWTKVNENKLATIEIITEKIREIINSMIGTKTVVGSTEIFAGLSDRVEFNTDTKVLKIGSEKETEFGIKYFDGIEVALATTGIKSGRYDPEYDFGDHVGPALVLVLEDDTEIAIPADELIDVYTAGRGIEIESNEISLKLSNTNNGSLILTDDGLKFQIVALPSGHSHKLAVVDTDNHYVLSESDYEVQSNGTGDNIIPTTQVVSDIITTAINTALNPVITRIDNLENNYTTLEERVNQLEAEISNINIGTEETFEELDAMTSSERKEKLATEELVYNTATKWGSFVN